MDKADIKFNVMLPEKLHERLRKEAFKQHRPMSELIRDAINEYLNK